MCSGAVSRATKTRNMFCLRGKLQGYTRFNKRKIASIERASVLQLGVWNNFPQCTAIQ